jgi:hypothetical protein
VLVCDTSRFAWNQVEGRRCKQMLRERLGIKVLSVTQPMGDDHSDPSAFLAKSIKVDANLQGLDGSDGASTHQRHRIEIRA